MNSFHKNIRFTIEINPEKFLDTKLIIENDGKYTTAVHRKETKVTPHWTSAVPKRYKRNTINGDLSRAAKISSDFEKEKEAIRLKYNKAEYPKRFVNSVIRDFESKKRATLDDFDFIIPPNFFDEPKQFITLEIPYCPENETASKRFLKKFNIFTQQNYQVVIKWITRKTKSLFQLKDRNPYPACQIYKGTCVCGKSYIGETIRNVQTRWKEHEDARKDSEPAKHLLEFSDHKFTWKTLLPASKNYRQRRNLEAILIAINGPELNNQLNTQKLNLFRNGIT